MSVGCMIKLFSDVIDSVEDHVDDYDQRKALYLDLMETFQEYDSGVIIEVLGISVCFDDAVYEKYPNYYGGLEDLE